MKSNVIKLKPRKPERSERELHSAIARVETLVREGRSEREIAKAIREQFAA